MNKATLALIDATHRELRAMYAGYDLAPAGERVLLCMALLADRVKVREEGTNRGTYVEAFLDAAGQAPGNPWCASALVFACRVAGYPPIGGASVFSWRLGFQRGGGLTDRPKRGDVCMRSTGGGKGHIGVAVKVLGPFVYSIEGNTSSGSAGSQRDGDGLYRRVRLKRFWSWGFGQLK